MAWLFRLLHLHRRVRIEPLPREPWRRDQQVAIERAKADWLP